jgi:hypothetical protein
MIEYEKIYNQLVEIARSDIPIQDLKILFYQFFFTIHINKQPKLNIIKHN